MNAKQEYAKKWRESHRDKKNAEAREYYATHREERNAKKKAYLTANVSLNSARKKLVVEIARGAAKASEFMCVGCGKQAQDWHHWSYEPEHQLSVIPLCKSCHKLQHGVTPNPAIGPWFAVVLVAPRAYPIAD